MNKENLIIETAMRQGRIKLSEFESKQLLAGYRISVVEEMLVDDAEAAADAAQKIGFPLVLKACAHDISHKTEGNLIEIDIRNTFELSDAFDRLHQRSPGTPILVQEMVKGQRELVVGFTRDPLFGPCVMFGLGGIFAEALGDVSFRLAPLSIQDAIDMIEEIQSRAILGPIRGMPGVDMAALVEIILSVGKAGLNHPEIHSIDVNPLIIRVDKPVAVDALVVLGTPTASTEAFKLQPDRLRVLFEPENVAVIGASGTPHKAGNDVVVNILTNHYKGDLYLVNPKGGTILEHDVYPAIAALPHGIDQAIIVLPAKATPQCIRDCAARGIKSIILAAGGFAEAGDDGRMLQEQTLEAIRETGMLTLGPNTSGHVSTPHYFTSSFFPLGEVPKGPISYIAQTGNFATHTMRYIMSAENFGVARVIGLGNKLDIEESEVLEYYEQDPETSAIIMYLEGFKYPRRFLKTAARVTRKKPVILLKSGATPEGAKAAVAHTASLAADDRMIDSALKQAGVVRIHEYSHLFLAAKALAFMPLPMGNRVGFLAPSGAMSVSLTDFCRRRCHLEVPQLEEKNRQRLQEISPEYIRMRNPVDIWPAAAASGVEFAYREAAEAVLRDTNIDAVVTILMLTDQTGIPDYGFLVELKDKYPDKPHYVAFSGDKKHMDNARDYLEPFGIPTFPLIEQPFVVLSILAQCRKALNNDDLS